LKRKIYATLLLFFVASGCSIFRAERDVPLEVQVAPIIGVGAGRLIGPSAELGYAEQYRGKLYWPVPGAKVFSKFGRRFVRWHDGVDLAAKRGTPIYAAHSGKVEYSGSGFNGYGNFIAIRGKGLTTFYAHNDRNLVRTGDYVEGGQLIAYVGKTGRTTGPHLHFETRIHRPPHPPTAIDPLKFFSQTAILPKTRAKYEMMKDVSN
jgi:murein DD-endopeptidase MepM/ murein hydrolase activator NlpD